DLPLRAVAYAAPAAGSQDLTVLTMFESIDGAPLASASVALFDETNTLKKQWTAKPEELTARPAMASIPTPAGSYRVRVAGVAPWAGGAPADYAIDAHIPRADPLKLSALVLGVQSPSGFAPRLDFKDESTALGMVQIYGVPKGGSVKVDLDVAS